tara:strand:+ start:3516 stop:5501 length:1986 start_codon:yes stop_codon:yes gene_type:complete
MGGVAGHMDHLYDNPELKFSEMKQIMEAASNGELTAEEKVDGQNLFLSYSVPEGKAKGARNKGNLKSGGLDSVALATKFAGRGNLEEAFTGGFKAFEEAAEALSDEEKIRIFGPDTNIWYNAEIMDPSARNVIKYDGKTLKIHNVGHFNFDRETGEQQPIPDGSLETLDNALERMQQALHGNDYSLARQAIINLQKLEDDTALQEAQAKIDSAISAEGLNDSNTVQDYVFSRLMNGIDTELSDDLKEELVKYLMKLPGQIGLKQLKKGLSPENLKDLNQIIATKRTLFQEAIYPLEVAVHNFTVAILKGLKSIFIADNTKEVERLKDELSAAVRQITDAGAEDPYSMQIMQRQLNKIKDFSKITTPIEAIVFDYNGHTYKFAGNFAPINQILGLFRYPKKTKKLTSENKIIQRKFLLENQNKKIALIPGGFKPPHAGHFELAKYFSDMNEVDEVIIIVSTKARPPVGVDAAIKLWELYTKEFPKIKVQKGTTPSPVGDVYDLVANNSVFQSGDVALLGKSEKDTDDKRFERAQSYAERNNPGVIVEPVITPLFAGGVSGTQMRNLLNKGMSGKDEFISYLPRHLSADEKQEAYEIASSTSNEGFNNFIDSALSEISTMAGGAVEGTAGGFGSPNRYNVYRRPKPQRVKKGKVNKGKRQRRR